VQTVRQWLEQLGLAQYVEIFERNAVDLELLCKLRDEDLERVDVPVPGHRKKLSKATAQPNGGVAPTVTIRASRPLKESIGAQVEHRHLPVVFCDLLGLTPLATKLGLKQLRAELFHYVVLGVPQSRSSGERRSC